MTAAMVGPVVVEAEAEQCTQTLQDGHGGSFRCVSDLGHERRAHVFLIDDGARILSASLPVKNEGQKS
jgi:hypothetical protein